jgi:hypothetical protein
MFLIFLRVGIFLLLGIWAYLFFAQGGGDLHDIFPSKEEIGEKVRKATRRANSELKEVPQRVQTKPEPAEAEVEEAENPEPSKTRIRIH